MQMRRGESGKCLQPHTWMVILMTLLSVAYMICGHGWRQYVGPLAWAVSVGFAVVEVRKNGIRRSRCNALLAAIALLYTAITIVRRDLSAYAWCNLGLCVAALLIGVVPARMSREDICRETRIFGLVVTLAYLPFVLVALVSVFTAKPIFLVNAGQAVGIQKLGRVSGRIYVGVHPNYTAQICVHCMLLVLYLFRNTARRWAKPLYGLAFAVFLVGLSHAQSRSGTILLGVAVGALLFRWSWNRFERRWLGCLVGAALTAVSVVAALLLTNAVFSLDVRLATRLNPWITRKNAGTSRVLTDGVLNLTENGRGNIWRAVLMFLRRRPSTLLVGRGAGGAFSFVVEYIPNQRNYGYFHNNWLETIMRGGLPMLFLICALLIMLVRPCARQLLGPGSGGEQLGAVRPTLILIMVMVTISESMLFIYASFPNIVFFTMCSHIMALDGAMETAGKAGRG